MILLLVILIPLFLFIFLGRHSLLGFRKLPPGPNTFQLLRKLSSLPKKPHVAFDDLSKTYGPLMSFRLGGRLVILSSSPSVTNEIFKTNNRFVTGRFLPSTFDRIPGAKNATLVMATDCNDKWKFMRTLGHNSIYSTRAIRSASGVRRAKASEMVGFLRAHKAGRIVNLEDVVSAAFTNIISNILTSKNLFHAGGEGERDEEVRRFFQGVVEKVTSTFGFVDLFPAMRGFDFWNKRKGVEFYDEVQLIWNDIIKERRANMISDHDRVQSDDYFDVLNEHGFSDGHIALLFTEQLLAATDSSTITSVWLLSELIKNRDILNKVRDEIESKAVGDDGTLDESLMSECRYFEACLKETLRLHIPGPFLLPRRATETFCMSNGFTIPKDSIVVVNGWAIQRSAENWEDPTRFDPTRFMGTKKFDYKGTHFEFVPFGSGQRMCPGWNVAVKGIQLLVASLIIYFDWALPDGVDPTKLDTADRFGTTLKKDQPLRLIPTPRDIYVIH